MLLWNTVAMGLIEETFQLSKLPTSTSLHHSSSSESDVDETAGHSEDDTIGLSEADTAVPSEDEADTAVPSEDEASGQEADDEDEAAGHKADEDEAAGHEADAAGHKADKDEAAGQEDEAAGHKADVDEAAGHEADDEAAGYEADKDEAAGHEDGYTRGDVVYAADDPVLQALFGVGGEVEVLDDDMDDIADVIRQQQSPSPYSEQDIEETMDNLDDFGKYTLDGPRPPTPPRQAHSLPPQPPANVDNDDIMEIEVIALHQAQRQCGRLSSARSFDSINNIEILSQEIPAQHHPIIDLDKEMKDLPVNIIQENGVPKGEVLNNDGVVIIYGWLTGNVRNPN